MDTLKIKSFLLIAKNKSFSKTAKEFSYTPSAVSHMADALENEIGIKLFNRTNKGIELTDDAKKLYDKFRNVIAAETALTDAAADIIKKKNLTLKIGCFSSIALHVLPEILQSFKQAYPSVKTTISVDDYMQHWIETGVTDIVFTDDLNFTKQWIPIMKDEYVAVVPENWFAFKTEITIDELYLHPIIRLDEKVLENYFDYSKFKEILPLNSIENNSAVYMVRENLGVAVLPKLSMNIVPSGVKILKLSPEISRIIGIEYDENTLSWAGERFLKHVKKFVK